MIWEDASFIGFPRNTPAPANWVDWRNQNTVFTDIAATRGAGFSLTSDGPPEQIFGRRVTANLWTILGVKPLLGRFFTAEEEQANAALVVIGYGLWQRRYGGERSILGRKILMDGRPFEVIAVMPREFSFPSRQIEVWRPAAFTPAELARRGSHYLQCVARLRSGVSLQQAQTGMNGIMQRLAQAYPETNRNVGAVVVPLRQQMLGNTQAILIALICAAACVLLIACANIGNLLLARGNERRSEMALRAAIGAGRTRLIRQLLTESLLLSGLGAAAGLAIARLGMAVLDKLIPMTMAVADLQLNPRALAFTAGISILTGLLFGVAPALAGTQRGLHNSLKQGGRGPAGRAPNFLRDGLVNRAGIHGACAAHRRRLDDSDAP
jgi:predicted permease